MTMVIWCSTPLSTLFRSYRGDGRPGRVIMKGSVPLRKQAYSNILKILPPKKENFG